MNTPHRDDSLEARINRAAGREKKEASPIVPAEFRDSEWLRLPERYKIRSAVMGHATFDENVGERTPNTFSTNNSIVVCTDAETVTRVAYSLRRRIDMLMNAGFDRGYDYVPFSNGEEPMNPELHERWRAMRMLGTKERQLETAIGLTEYNAEEARGMKLKALDPQKWIYVEGLEYGAMKSGRPVKIPRVYDDTNSRKGMYGFGTYLIQHGMIFCLTRNGELVMSPHTPGRQMELETKGYKPREEREDDRFLEFYMNSEYGGIQTLLETNAHVRQDCERIRKEAEEAK